VAKNDIIKLRELSMIGFIKSMLLLCFVLLLRAYKMLFHRPFFLTKPVNKDMTNSKIKMKNNTFAIPAAAEAMPPKPKTAAINAITKNINAQFNMMMLLFFLKMPPRPQKCGRSDGF
jgi:hypothetical protein